MTRYFLGRMDVLGALAETHPPIHKVQIEIEVTSDAIDPEAKEVHEAILAATESRVSRLLSDKEGTGELTMIPVAWVRQILAQPISTEIDDIKIWGVTLQKQGRLPKRRKPWPSDA